MKVGSLVFATEQGLGILAKAFYDYDIVTDVLVIRHGRRPERDDWYPNSGRISDLRAGKHTILEFCKSMDVMLFFETPFDWSLIPWCREHGVKTVLMPMHECHPKDKMPGSGYEPDLYACPSLLDFRVFANTRANGIINPFDRYYWTNGAVLTPVPVEVPWKLRTRAEVFVHNAGHGGLKGRNGTAELLEAIPLVQSPAKFVIRSQVPFGYGPHPLVRDKRVQFQIGTINHDQLFAEGDVFVFPEKFNGLSLPLQEARAAGMLVMCGDRFPMNEWLPTSIRLPLDAPITYADGSSFYILDPCVYNPLIPVSSYRRSSVAARCLDFDEAVFEPKAIAAKIDEWYGRDITTYSESGREWAKTMSWEAIGPKWKAMLEDLL